MNPLITPTNSLFLPLSQLNPHCNRLLNSLYDGRTGQKERLLYESTLWNEVKKIRALNDSSVFLYLIGYYHTILYHTRLPFTQKDLFQYHVLIRLGDLNRYLERVDVAEYYYCNARNLFPCFGHAYNQLGLLTDPSNCYKCCYYYVRAAKSTDKPLSTVADSNLRIAITKYSCETLNHILNYESDINTSSTDRETDRLPKNAFEWFYVIVVAIYADNIQPITKIFLTYINENFSTQRSTTALDQINTTTIYCDRNSYILLACLDILLDWLKLGSQGKVLLPIAVPELRQIRTLLQTVYTSISKQNQLSISNSCTNSPGLTHVVCTNSTTLDSTLTSTSDSPSRSSSNSKLPALPHDYVLRGFSPLDIVHRSLMFEQRGTENRDVCGDMNENLSCKRFIESAQLIQLLCRIKTKMSAFGPLIRRQTRNIALESILSSMERSVDL